MEIMRASTADLGERLKALAYEHNIGKGERWDTIACPEAAAIIAELRRRHTGRARDALEAAGVSAHEDPEDALRERERLLARRAREREAREQ